MRTLVFGATGLAGQGWMEHLLAEGQLPLGTGYRRPSELDVALDIRDEVAVAELIAEYEPEVIVVAAGPMAPDYAEQFPAESRERIVDGLQNVLAAADPSTRIVLMSSTAVYDGLAVGNESSELAARCEL
ncbi:MAG: NAD-dependent epimerase/dehydratase family protein, partial [Gemmataceae bacterium]